MKQTEIILGGGLAIYFYLEAEDTNQQLTMFKVVIHPNARVPAAHYHQHFDETIYCLKGLIHFTIDGNPVELRAGDYYFIPRGTPHGFVNKTQETVEMLCYVTPGVFSSAYFKEIAAVLNAGGPPDMQQLKAIMLRHGLVPVPAAL
ncbi:cupin domain-containing protein [Spirosoma sp. BT702]|uniref:Cupin domain-containing protein n=1 Tax=Spirosoma profusum TaxID=2771354 RepID=A0A927GA35_9BACT|nr:cupin domain-containing protein [Spirosoma profusum]MBD2705232.1 cupin domain-containing protein [Spirosoma profusum]